jgi:phosphatidylserine/phosphatidylglycerophosphate/cardiolipin synthase-like enzyme
MYDPLGSDSQNEWIEIYNNGSVDVNVTDWIISDSEGADDFIFPNLLFPPGNFIVIHSGPGANETIYLNGTLNLYMGKTSSFLENTGDDVLLRNSTGDGVDYVAYDFGSYVDPCPLDLEWDDMNVWVDSEGNSVSLHPNGWDTDSGLAWEESDPTPGFYNAHLDDYPPEISNVMHLPQNPTSSEPVNISVNVTEDYQLDSVTLYYSIDGGLFNTLSMNYYLGNYTAIIPSQADGSEITYYVEAKDDANQSSQSQHVVYAHSDLPFQVVINEFLANPESDWNNDTFFDSDDEWIELFNAGDTVVNLGGWVIDDKLGSLGSSNPYTIPLGRFIRPGEFLLFYGNETNVILNDFGDENVTLLDSEDNIIDMFSFTDSADDTAQGRYPDGSLWKNFLSPTPGSENLYPVDSLANLAFIKINEFLPAPKAAYSKEWIELYNSGTQPVSLDGCYLDDTLGSGTKPWQIPLNTTLQPREFVVFERSFGLNNAGDSVNLVYVDKSTVIDSYSYTSSEYDVSYARAGDGDDHWWTLSNPTPGVTNPPHTYYIPDGRPIKICKLFYRSSEETEFIGLFNPSNVLIDIGGWRISDGVNSYSGTIIFPQGTEIPSKGHLYIANMATIFNDIMGFMADLEYGNSWAQVPEMEGGEPPSFAMNSDEVRLMTDEGILIDIAVYGDSDYDGPGWIGHPISDAKKGEYLIRNFDEVSNTYEDTNTASDWKHMRQYKVGQSESEFMTFSYNGSLTVFSSPDSAFDTIISELDLAQSEILIGMYEFTNWNLSAKIIERLQAGVTVRILMEGSPVGGISENQKYLLSKIHENGGEVRYLVTNSSLGPRYNFLHSKYAVLDNFSVIISSENWKYTGVPVNNTYGNRGWGVIIKDETVAQYFAELFLSDWQHVEYDIMPFTPEHDVYGNASLSFVLDDFVETWYYSPNFSSQSLSGNFGVSPVLAPDSTLLESESILGLINSATETIYIEQLECDLSWNDGEEEYDNLYLKTAISAAENRQVKVKILLSSLFAYPDDPKLDNYDTYLYINSYAQNHNITEFLEARLVDFDRLGLAKVHNKGMVVDGKWTLISSINWNRNSVAQNREVGVIIENEQVAQYFTEIFYWDFNEPPKANAGEDLLVDHGSDIHFLDLSEDSDDNIISYFWDFDDGSTSSEQNPTHRYENEGVYEVKLTVFDGQYQDSHTITVLVLKNESAGGELSVFIYGVLVIIFILIFIAIIVFIRKMKFKFI